MPNYIRPGTYVEEFLNPISDIAADPGVAAAAFVGTSSGGGPVGPLQINSWSQFQALYGGVSTANDDLAYGVYSYFANGGPPCYIVRGINTDAVKASLSILDTQGTPAATLQISASAAGTWASAATSSSRVFVTVQPSTPVGRFDVVIEIGTANFIIAREQFLDLTMDPNDGRNAIEIINSPVVGSKYVVATALWTGTYASNKNPAITTKVPLTGGTDGTGSPDLYAATQLLAALDLNLVINLPGISDTTVLTNVVNWAVTSGRHFVVADVPKPATGELAPASVTAQTAFATAMPKVSQLAIYGPWLYITDPGSRAGSMRLTAPGGAVVGQILRTDASRGVFKAPAGVQTALLAVIAPYLYYTDAQQDSLVSGMINLIKRIPGGGVCIWGARTQASGFPDRYIPVRRMLIHLKSSLQALTRFAVFENNDDDLWSTVQDVCETYLTTQMEIGALKGTNADEAFYVRCDETINTPDQVAAGVVNIEIGVALQTPAEFIVIRLGQTQAGTVSSDSLEE
jgi:phage tail sheath protein FI